MILRWGRKGLIAGALAVTFVSPLGTATYVNEVQHRPSFKYEVRHITPEAGPGLHRVQIRPDSRLEFRHVTPTGEAAPPEIDTSGYYGTGGLVGSKNDDDDVIALIMAMYETGVLN